MRVFFILLILVGVFGVAYIRLMDDSIAKCRQLQPGITGKTLVDMFGDPYDTVTDKETGRVWTLFSSCPVCSDPIRAVLSEGDQVDALDCSQHDEGIDWERKKSGKHVTHKPLFPHHS